MFKIYLEFIVFSIKLSTFGAVKVSLFFLQAFCDVFGIYLLLLPLSRGLKRGSFSNTNTDWLKTRPSGNDQPPHFCFRKFKCVFCWLRGLSACIWSFFTIYSKSHDFSQLFEPSRCFFFPAWIRAVTSSGIIATV